MYLQKYNKMKTITFISFPSTKNIAGTTDGQLSIKQYEYTLEYLIDFFNKYNEKVYFRVKPHPVDNNISFIKKNTNITHESIENIINTSDVLIGVNSTVIFNSILFNKPYILLNWYIGDIFLLEQDNYPFISRNEIDFFEVLKSTEKFSGYNSNIINNNIEYIPPESYDVARNIISKFL